MHPRTFFELIKVAQPELAAEICHLTLRESRIVLNKATGLNLHGASRIDAGCDAYWAAINHGAQRTSA